MPQKFTPEQITEQKEQLKKLNEKMSEVHDLIMHLLLPDWLESPSESEVAIRLRMFFDNELIKAESDAYNRLKEHWPEALHDHQPAPEIDPKDLN